MAAPGAPTPRSHLGGGVCMQRAGACGRAAAGAQTIAGGGGGGGGGRHGEGQQSAQRGVGGRRKGCSQPLLFFFFPLPPSGCANHGGAGGRSSCRPPSCLGGEPGEEARPRPRNKGGGGEKSSGISGSVRQWSGGGGTTAVLLPKPLPIGCGRVGVRGPSRRSPRARRGLRVGLCHPFIFSRFRLPPLLAAPVAGLWLWAGRAEDRRETAVRGRIHGRTGRGTRRSAQRAGVLCSFVVSRLSRLGHEWRTWIGWGPGQPGPVGGIPVHSRGLEMIIFELCQGNIKILCIVDKSNEHKAVGTGKCFKLASRWQKQLQREFLSSWPSSSHQAETNWNKCFCS
ncbi:uncharacterized protein LOC122171574 [Centrocercus urophasianus]|uniref:uncharacterized protein LOC122171574 n=1 Tax=Centrocercus urophasianus TaxID=9002 RepID=UPI001C65100C|nr:uncharacterized protein LOC122171574 [Centrocercus urophasianus]